MKKIKKVSHKLEAEDIIDKKKGIKESKKEDAKETNDKKVITIRKQPKSISNIMSRMMKIKGK